MKYKSTTVDNRFENIYDRGLSGRKITLTITDIDCLSQLIHSFENGRKETNQDSPEVVLINALKKMIGYKDHLDKVNDTRKWIFPESSNLRP